MSVITHHDAEGFEDVEFAHGTSAVLVKPGVHTHFMEDMSNETQKTHFNKQD